MTVANPTSPEDRHTRLRVQPALSAWRLREMAELSTQQLSERDRVLNKCDTRAVAMGWPGVGMDRSQTNKKPRIIATGHQAQLWHPGILAKDLAAIAAAMQHDAIPLHVVVDQDEHPVWQVDIPSIQGDQVAVKRHRLPGPAPLAGVPTGFQPAVDAQQLADFLGEAGLPVPSRIDGAQTLAQQVAGVCDHWRAEALGQGGRLLMVFASDLTSSDVFAAAVGALKDGAHQAISAYNQAVYAVPEARLRPLAITREWIELPLWACRWNKPRQRVYADLADRRVILVDESGQRIEHGKDAVTLMPRALLMTALLRQTFCDLFIHGTGGGVYDRVAEQWWHRWQGETLAPMATVTADVYFNLNVPTATKLDVEQAVWYRHHLPFNLDRFADTDPALTREKRQLIEHMDDDRNKPRRAKAFARIHQINEVFFKQHQSTIEAAEQQVAQSRSALSNARTLARRDWCFGLYPQAALQALQEQVRELL